MRSSTAKAPVEPSLRPIERPIVVSGSLWVETTQMSASISPSLVTTAAQLPAAALEALQAGAEVQRGAERREALLHRLGDLRVGHLRQQPRVLVDEVGLDARGARAR